MDSKNKEKGILKLEPRRPTTETKSELTPQGSYDRPPSSPQPSVDRLSVTWAEPGSMTSSGVNLFHLPSETAPNNEVKFSPSTGDGSEDEDYSVSLSAVLRQRRASVRRSRKGRTRRPSSPFLPDRRSSVFTTSSGDTAISIEDQPVVTQEQIFENIHLHKEVLGSVKQQPLGMRRKLKIVHQAKGYIKRHEGQLQERLAQSKSTKDIYARFNILLATKWQQLKREAANTSNILIPWELRIKEIESHFGSVVASYFTFLRWLFWVNLVIGFILLVFVIIPECLTADPAQDGERKVIMDDERRNATNLLTLWEFEGVLKYSPIFYGYYSNVERKEYRMPLAYFLTGLVVYIYSFVAILRKMAENSRMSKLSEKEDECIFSWKVFTGWDFMIGNAETAHNRIASIILGFKEALLEEAEKKKKLRNWRIISLRILVNLSVVVLLAVSAYAVVYVVSRSDDNSKFRNWFKENETTIVVTVISITFPFFFEMLGFLEHYHPRKQLRLQLGRIMFLNLLNLYSLIFALFSKIEGMSKDLVSLQPTLHMNATVFNNSAANEDRSCSEMMVPCVPCDLLIESRTHDLPSFIVTLDSKKNEILNNNFNIRKQYPHYTTTEIYENKENKNVNKRSILLNTDDYMKSTVPGIEETNDTILEEDYFDGNFLSPISTDLSTETDLNYEYTQSSNSLFSSTSTNLETSSDVLSSSILSNTEGPHMDNFTETVFTTDFFNHFETTNYDLIDNYEFDSKASTQSVSNSSEPTSISITERLQDVNEENEFSSTKFYDSQTEISITNEGSSSSTPTSQLSSTLPNRMTCANISFNCSVICGDKNITKVFTISNCKIVGTKCYMKQCSIMKENSVNSQKNVTNTTVKDIVFMVKHNRKVYNLSIETRKKLLKLCWETMIGQELVKLTMMDLVFVLLGTLFLDFFRALFVRYMNRCWCWDLEKKFPEYGDFKIAENILHLINNQGMVWMGMFFSPGLVVLNIFKLMIMMYLRSWAVMTCNVPHEVVFRVSKSNNFYLALLLTMLFLCVLPVGYSIVWVIPSWHCGPFSEYDKIYKILTSNIYKILPRSLNFTVEYIASPAIVIPLLVLLILIIYYLTSLTNSLREANNDLKIQLRRERTEERRKMFQLADTRRRAGSSSIDNTPFARWKKALPSLPITKSIDSDDRNTDRNSKEPNTVPKKKGGIFAKIVGLAIDKKTNGEDISSALCSTQDIDTGTDILESIPKDNINTKDISVHKNTQLKKKISVEFKTDDNLHLQAQVIDDCGEKEAMAKKIEKDCQEEKITNIKIKDLKEKSVDKYEQKINNNKSTEKFTQKKQSSESSNVSKNTDSIGSVIPVITISNTESDDEMVQSTVSDKETVDIDHNEDENKSKVPKICGKRGRGNLKRNKNFSDLKSLQRQSSVDSINEKNAKGKEPEDAGHKYQYSL